VSYVWQFFYRWGGSRVEDGMRPYGENWELSHTMWRQERKWVRGGLKECKTTKYSKIHLKSMKYKETSRTADKHLL
jgi:hypothetical protein